MQEMYVSIKTLSIVHFKYLIKALQNIHIALSVKLLCYVTQRINTALVNHSNTLPIQIKHTTSGVIIIKNIIHTILSLQPDNKLHTIKVKHYWYTGHDSTNIYFSILRCQTVVQSDHNQICSHYKMQSFSMIIHGYSCKKNFCSMQ